MAGAYAELLPGHPGTYQPDRDLAAAILRACPEAAEMAAHNREFIARVVLWAAREGIRQVIDAGCGLPRPDGQNIHDLAAGIRVAYADIDEETTARMRLAALRDGVVVVEGDLRDPESVLGQPAVQDLIDRGERVLLLAAAVIHYYSEDVCRRAVAAWAARLAAGSVIAVTAGRFGPKMPAMAQAYVAAGADGCRAGCHDHSPAALARIMAGLELAGPGIAPARCFRPGWEDSLPLPEDRAYMLAGLGRIR